MSQDNVELVRAICAPWEHGDYSSVEWAHPEIEFVIPDGPTPGGWRGLAGMSEGYGAFLRAWDDVRTDLLLFQIRGGKVTRLVAYWDRDRALEAVGLSE